MALTDFGTAVRIARIQTGYTLRAMAQELKISSAYLCSLENGKRKISREWVRIIYDFFADKGYVIDSLPVLADASNGFVSLADLPQQQKTLIAWMAKRPLSTAQIKKVTELLEKKNV